jgi:hypothetical protein
MDWSEWQTVAAIASDLVLSATLIVFLRQARTMRAQLEHLALQTEHVAREEDRSSKALRAGVYQSLSGLMIDVDRTFIAYPELRRYFYDGVPEPTDVTERSRVSAIAEMFVDLIDNFVAQAPHLPEYMSGPWGTYFEYLFRSSPAIQRFWQENRSWYSGELQRFFDSHLQAAAEPLT